MAVETLADYLAGNQGLDAAGAALSDTGVGSLLGSLDPYTLAASGVLDLISLFGGPNLDPLSAIMGALQGRPKMQATQDIASSGSKYSDPVIQLLSQGAQGLSASGTPISSSGGQANSFGPYFDVASKLENLLRWGTTNPTPQQANLTATTLKNALTELGNPGSGTGTLDAVEKAFTDNIGSLSPDTLKALMGQMSPQEQGILQGIVQQDDPKLAKQVWGSQGGSAPTGSQPATAPQYPNPEPALAKQEGQYVDQYKNYEQQYAGIQGQPGAPVPPPPPAPPGANASPQDEANYVQQYKNYERAYQGFQNQYGQYVNQYAQQQPTTPMAQLQQQYTDANKYMGPGRQIASNPGYDSGDRINAQRPPNCPPCPPSQGGPPSTTSGPPSITGMPPNQNLVELLQQLIGQTGKEPQNPLNPLRRQPGNNPNNPPTDIGNWLRLMGGNNPAPIPPSSTTPPAATTPPASSNPLQTLQNMLQLGSLGALFGNPGGFSYNWTVA